MIRYFNYYLTGEGWAEAFFSSDRENVRFEVSYLRDPISELFQGLYRLVNKQSDIEKIIFAEEPGEHSLVISKQENETIKVEIFWSDEWESLSNAPEDASSKKELIYSDIDTLTNFVSVICVGTDSLLEKLTLAEYKEKWNSNEFPSESYAKLRQTLY